MIIRNEMITEIRFKKNTISYVGEDGHQVFKAEIMYHKEEDNSISMHVIGSGFIPREIFAVENNSDIMHDYFEKDSATVSTDHPAYSLVYLGYLRYSAFYATEENKEQAQKELKSYRVKDKFDYEMWNRCVDYMRG